MTRVKTLLDKGADVNAKAPTGVTALMMASQSGHVDVVRALLAAKADVNAKTPIGDTALLLASQQGHAEVVKLLTASGASTSHPFPTPTGEYRALTSKDNLSCKALNSSIEFIAGVNMLPSGDVMGVVCGDEGGKARSVELKSTSVVKGRLGLVPRFETNS